MNLKSILKYLNYRITAYTEHDVHSPFVYEFYMDLIKNSFNCDDFKTLTGVRETLRANQELIKVTDLGAGSKKLAAERSIRDIARHGIAQKKQAEFLYRLIAKFRPGTMVELGTSIGLTALYLAKGAPESRLYTIEGCPELFRFSKALIQKQGVKNIISVTGNFNGALPQLLSEISTLDFIYIDGNHAYEPTIRYFNLALEKKRPSTIMVFDDIYWSSGMERAWKEICSHPEVTLSLDFFHFGIVFFRTEQKNKEHFVLKF